VPRASTTVNYKFAPLGAGNGGAVAQVRSKNMISLKGLAKITGISASQLSQYATGYRYPSPKTTAKIQQGLHTIANELSRVALV
jgi:transcriptional regulator with XRE-family HTH domain